MPIPVFKPHPWQVAPFLDKHEVMLLSGKPGGGKSHLAANKVHAFLLNYANATWVVARKKREAMDQSTIPLLLDEVIHINEEPRCRFHARADRVIYEHPGGNISELLFKGMFGDKQRESWKSVGMKGDVDGILWEEANEFDEEDYNFALPRLRGRAANWRQFVLCTNPDTRMHWINVRLILGGEAAYYYSDWTMNPSIDHESYGRTMDKLTGVARARFYMGEWTDGIGLVVDTWANRYNPLSSPKPTQGNVTPEADYDPNGGDVIWVVDDGYSGQQDSQTGYFSAKSQPRAFLIAQKRTDGGINVFGEHYAVMKMYQPHISEVIQMCRQQEWPKPRYVLFDGRAPTLGRYLNQAGLEAIPYTVKIEEGLSELRNWVGADENGVRLLHVHPRCRQVVWEFGSYVYHSATGKPIDAFNHGIDALRYLTFFIANGEPPAVSVAAPGIDVYAIEERVQREVQLAMLTAEKKLAELMSDEGNMTWTTQR